MSRSYRTPILGVSFFLHACVPGCKCTSSQHVAELGRRQGKAPGELSRELFAFIVWCSWDWWKALFETLRSGLTENTSERSFNDERPGCCEIAQVYGGTAEQLKAYRVGITPPENYWVEVADSVFFQQVRCSRRVPEAAQKYCCYILSEATVCCVFVAPRCTHLVVAYYRRRLSVACLSPRGVLAPAVPLVHCFLVCGEGGSRIVSRHNYPEASTRFLPFRRRRMCLLWSSYAKKSNTQQSTVSWWFPPHEIS